MTEVQRVRRELTPVQARTLTDAINTTLDGLWRQLVKAWEGRAHEALGYDSWDEYCSKELDTAHFKLPRAERREVVASMREAGMSTRDIAVATGVSQRTVVLDAGESNDSPGPVRGRDGKTYHPKSKPIVDPAPEPDEPEIVDAEIVEDEPAPTPRASKPRVDVVATVNRALMRAREAADSANQITAAHLRGRGSEAEVWSRDLTASIEALQRLNNDLRGVN